MSEAGNRKHEVGSSEDDEFELALTRALRRVEAPAGFAEKMVARTHVSESRRVTPSGAPGKLLVMMPKPKVWLSGAIAAALVAGVFVAQDVHQRHEREVANRQFALSMQIEERTMEHTRQQLQKAGVPLE
jgi:hypothetical protein